MLDSVPAEMVAKLLERGYAVAHATAAHAARMADNRARIRESLLDMEAIIEVPDDVLDLVSLSDEDVAAVDGAVICENQSIGDLCAAVAVTVGPRDGQGTSDVYMESVPRNAKNKDRTTAIMAAMEIEAAAGLDARVVLVDGSMQSGLITMSSSLHAVGTAMDALSERVRACANANMRSAVEHLLSRSCFVALPKYVTKNDLISWLPSEFHAQDAKTLATMALHPGEMTPWIDADTSGKSSNSSIARALGCSDAEERRLTHLMASVMSCYYRPHPWTPAFRLDVARTTADDPEATTMIIRAIRDNTLTSGIMEPFPLYLVDQYAKKISDAAGPMVSMAAMENLEDDDAQLMLAMRYRT